MKVLVACEESQRVTIELRKLGNEAYSCDLHDCSGNHPEWHIKKDVTLLLNGNCIFNTVDGVEHEISGKWDMIIAFPPCTYLTVTGNRWFNHEKYGDKAIQRMLDRNDAIKFFMRIENPVGVMSTQWRNDCNYAKNLRKTSFYGMFGGFPAITEMYNNKCFCCPADRQGNRCGGEQWCKETWKRYEAITNPEWHHVSLATLANIDFDMLDKKRQVYLKAHRELKRTLADLSKCKTGHTYEARARKFMRDMISQYYDNEISYAMRKYLDLQLSMSNVVNGVWSSYVEPATGLHESRRYSRPTLTY